ERAAGRVEAHGDRPLEAGTAELACRADVLAFVGRELLDMTARDIDAHDAEPHGMERLAGRRRLVAELGDESFSDMTEGIRSREIEADGRGMHAEDGDRRGRLAGLAGEKRGEAFLHRRTKIFVRDGFAFRVIGPAVPGARRDAPEHIARAPHRAAASI